jgi:hypothetical protein
MRQDRNVGYIQPYPMYPYQMPMMIDETSMENLTTTNQCNNNSRLEQRVNNLERRVSKLETMINKDNNMSSSTTYTSDFTTNSNYQMM